MNQEVDDKRAKGLYYKARVFQKDAIDEEDRLLLQNLENQKT